MIILELSNGLAGSIYTIARFISSRGAPFWEMLAEDIIGVNKALTTALLLATVDDILPIMQETMSGYILSTILWGSSLGGVLVLTFKLILN